MEIFMLDWGGIKFAVNNKNERYSFEGEGGGEVGVLF